MPPATGTPTIHPNNAVSNVPQIVYSTAQQMYINFRRMRMMSARDTRDTSRQEWDDMTFLKYYEILKKADDQYVAPRKNEGDTSINLGTIRDKDTSLVEYAMSHDFEPVAQVFDDEDDMLEELAETGEDLVRKSLTLDNWEDKCKLVYRSMVSFGTALVEELWVERWILNKTLSKGFRPGMGTNDAQWTEKLVKQYDGCQAKLWDLRKCYPGDIRKFFMNGPQGQPFFFTVEYESYDVTKQLYGNWDRWVNVPTTVVPTAELSTGLAFSSSWTLRAITQNICEIVKYYDPIANEFAITINGVDMLPILESKKIVNGEEKTFISGYPLTEVSPSGAIPFAKYDLEPMHDFFYSKSQPGKMRVSADVENMLVKLFIIMFKQKAKPTMGNKSGRQFGPEITDPATVVNDVRDGDLFPILPNYQGALPADFSFFEMMKKELDKNSVERSWQGMDTTNGAGPTQNDDTATKSMNDMKAQSLKVAAMFDGIISGNKQLYWLRTFNIMKNWTKPIDQEVDTLNKTLVNKYRTVTLPTEIDGGQKATKKIVFTKSTPKLEKGTKKASLNDSFDVYQEELDHQKKGGGELRTTYLHPELFAQAKLSWFYTCVPVPNGNDPLGYMLFAKQITDAQTFFGPDSLNVKKLKHRFAAKTGNDFDTWFLSEQELELKQQAAAAAATPATPAAGPGKVPGKPVAGGPTQAGAASGAKPALKIGSLTH